MRVIDRRTRLPVQVQTLEDAHGKFNPLDPRWNERYAIVDERGDEIVYKEPTREDVIRADIEARLDDIESHVDQIRQLMEEL